MVGAHFASRHVPRTRSRWILAGVVSDAFLSHSEVGLELWAFHCPPGRMLQPTDPLPEPSPHLVQLSVKSQLVWDLCFLRKPCALILVSFSSRVV